MVPVTKIDIPSSKSITNRLLILQQYKNYHIKINNISVSADSILLQKCLLQISQPTSSPFVFVDNCGTAFRFLCAYLSFRTGEWILDGSPRLRQRPIAPLVEAINNAGGEIYYMEKIGFAPLKIIGKQWHTNSFTIDSAMSSQFVSALMLCLPFNACNARIVFDKHIPSFQYINLSLKLMSHIGLNIQYHDGAIHYQHSNKLIQTHINVEADWSSAAFWYLYVALTNKPLFINKLTKSDIQPDAQMVPVMKDLGVTTTFNNQGALIEKTKSIPQNIEIDCINNPDWVPVLVTLCVGEQTQARLFNTKNLQFKESNRIEVLQKELAPFATLTWKNDYLTIKPHTKTFPHQHFFHSYSDHRIVMALAMLKHQIPHIEFDDKQCVKKSYPDFWKYYNQLTW